MPVQERDARLRILVGGLLSLVPVVNFVAWGYLYRIFIDGLNQVAAVSVPSWASWRDYWSVGLRLFAITLGYLVLIASGLVAILALFGSADFIAETRHVFVVGVISMAAFNAISPVVFARYAEERRVWAAFEPDVLWRDLRRIIRLDYVHLCMLYMGLWLMTFLILVSVPYLGPLLLSILHFYITLVFAFVFGHLVGLRRTQPPPQTSLHSDP